MTYIRPQFRHPAAAKNALGYTRKHYEGALSTLCAGCGHDSISNAIIDACFQLDIEPHRVAKTSGIGCSSKTPAYYLSNSHGFNSVHGRMPSVTTGANMANRDLIYLGVSGDGDTASIGMGQYVHAIRRNLNMLYIVMNNGCYGLTKGQDSATADKGSVSKKGEPNAFESIDLCAMAVQLGAGFVARSFSGDKRQLVPLIKAAMAHQGFAFLDVISPCVTFNNTPKSTKGYEWVRDHLEATQTLDYVPHRQAINIDYDAGSTRKVTLHNGEVVLLHKSDGSHDTANRRAAINELERMKEQQRILTGVIFADGGEDDTHRKINSCDAPLNSLPQADLCPGSQALEKINESFR